MDFLRRGTTAHGRKTEKDYTGRTTTTTKRKAVAEIKPFGNQPNPNRMPAFDLQQSRSSAELRRVPAFRVPPMAAQVMPPSSRVVPAHVGPKEGRKAFPIHTDIKRPLAVPSGFVDVLQGRDEKELPDRVADAYVQYRSSLQTKLADKAEDETDGFQGKLPSTSSYPELQSKPDDSKRTVFPRGINSISVNINVGDTLHQSNMDLQNSQVQTAPKEKSKRSDNKEGSHSQDLVRQDSRQVSEKREVSTKRGKGSSNTVKPDIGRRKKKSSGVKDDGSAETKMLSSRKRKKVSSDDHMERWENLEQMRRQSLKKNKTEFETDSVTQSHATYSPILVKQEGGRSFQEKSAYQSPTKHASASKPKRQKVSFSPAISSTDSVYTKPLPSITPSKCSNLATSIAKLKSSTPVTPGNDNSEIFLMSPFPTPDNALRIPSTESDVSSLSNVSEDSPQSVSEHTPPDVAEHLPQNVAELSPQRVSEHSPQNVSEHSPPSVLEHSPPSDLMDSLEEGEKSQESGMFWMEDSPEKVDADSGEPVQDCGPYHIQDSINRHPTYDNGHMSSDIKQGISVKVDENISDGSNQQLVSVKKHQRKGGERSRKTPKKKIKVTDERMMGKNERLDKGKRKKTSKETPRRRDRNVSESKKEKNPSKSQPQKEHPLKTEKCGSPQKEQLKKNPRKRKAGIKRDKISKDEMTDTGDIKPKRVKKSPHTTPRRDNKKLKKTPSGSQRKIVLKTTAKITPKRTSIPKLKKSPKNTPKSKKTAKKQNVSETKKTLYYANRRKKAKKLNDVSNDVPDVLESWDSDSSGPMVKADTDATVEYGARMTAKPESQVCYVDFEKDSARIESSGPYQFGMLMLHILDIIYIFCMKMYTLFLKRFW